MSNIDPTREQFEAFKDLPRDTPIMMLNLISLHDKAHYADGRKATGAEAYAAYGQESGSIFADVGGSILWRGKPECVLIGPATEHWDVAFIAHYPNAKAFLAMVTNPDYQAIVFHRQAAVKDSRLIRMGETEAGVSF
ncbi:MAG TPA: DUF1330 domain-containing protein [Gammaproteobacteria bacterium]|jgi:uncharacterized protein (DUF1330 family)|nr:DUF1330 domain-containing protein [Gammaproteobacteria bacterium]